MSNSINFDLERIHSTSGGGLRTHAGMTTKCCAKVSSDADLV